jgi:hypothetical protein
MKEEKYNEDVYVAAADYVMKNAPEYTNFEPRSYLLEVDYDKYKDTTRADELEKFKKYQFSALIGYMQQKGFIEFIGDFHYKLTDRARDIVQRGGYVKYQKYINHNSKPKGWHERHPILYALFLIVVTATLSYVVNYLSSLQDQKENQAKNAKQDSMINELNIKVQALTAPPILCPLKY